MSLLILHWTGFRMCSLGVDTVTLARSAVDSSGNTTLRDFGSNVFP